LTNDKLLHGLAVQLLERTRGWKATAETSAGTLMSTPGGETILLVSRDWGGRLGNSDYVRNGCSYAHHEGRAHGRGVLVALATMGHLGRTYAKPFVDAGLEIIEEQEFADMAGAVGIDAMECYAKILRQSQYPNREMLEPRARRRTIVNGEGETIAHWDAGDRTVDVTMPRTVAARVMDMGVRDADAADGDASTVRLSAWLSAMGDKGYRMRYGAAALPKAA
jgi:hypothetical protein